jgi:hemerythrin superfamily protein
MTTDDMSSTEGMTGASADAIELLTEQHQEVQQLWSQLQVSHRNGSNVQTQLARDIVTRLSRHDAIETQYLYPELRDHCGDEGRRIAEHSLQEHQEVRDLLSQVDGQDIREATIYSTMAKCMAEVKHHAAEEEDQAFSVLRRHRDEPRIMALGQMMSDAMKMAPTHPHRHMPDGKLGAAVAGAVSGLMDKARDVLGGRAEN